ncbi:hypothetical protein LX97_02861 [Nonlabens dokdonensis]|jgi:hypothetical protein|uniref:Uncharacterized protein n=2 Tax=Nonlabens dokdonensis TaxID=328515 RepID=L7WE26_NONDD|nr:hypothetical protein [Nonlabens dokdonensis]AGC78537.1 hypothetical protein DDD_3410 [Nonlabens dokdonensis DSW-6]PZX38280.1 hypothetical protein LX97_02861 [Nonlabens dokdonensis]
MFKKLEKILGKPMKYYENLMASRKENAQITDTQKQLILDQLKPIVINAEGFDSLPTISESDVKSFIEVPKNKKGISIPCKGIFKWTDQVLFLFVNDDTAIKDASSYELILKDVQQEQVAQKIGFQKGSELKSLPIWEEIIHRFPEVHKLIVKTHREHPWTLYKETAKEIEPITSYKTVLGGYPKWRINNIDFRKIEQLEFLLEYRIAEKDFSIYFFKDPHTHEISSFEQKD